MPNSIDYATIFRQELDKAFVPASVTGWMQQNARLSTPFSAASARQAR